MTKIKYDIALEVLSEWKKEMEYNSKIKEIIYYEP